jgi:hypothetical protein
MAASLGSLLLLLSLGGVVDGQLITTVAGSRTNQGSVQTGFPDCTWDGGGEGGPATSATLCIPEAVAFAGGNIFITDNGFGRLRMVNASGHISTFAGTSAGILPIDDGIQTCDPIGPILTNYGDGGPAASAVLRGPTFLAVNPSMTTLYLSASCDCLVHAITLATGVIHIFAGGGTYNETNFGDGGAATSAVLLWPMGIAVDATDTLVYIADGDLNVVRVVNRTSGLISTAMSTCVGSPLLAPTALAMAPDGELLVTTGSQVCGLKDGVVRVVANAAGAAGYSGDGGPATSAE